MLVFSSKFKKVNYTTGHFTPYACKVFSMIMLRNYGIHSTCNGSHDIMFCVCRDFYSISLKMESPVLLFQKDCMILNKMKKNQKGLIMNSFYHSSQVIYTPCTCTYTQLALSPGPFSDI